MSLQQHAHRLTQAGVALFLIGLLTGVALPALPHARLGVASHVNGLLAGLALIVLSLMWPRLRLGRLISIVACGLALFSMFTAWFIPLIASIWEAGGTRFPIAAGAAFGTALQETAITAALTTSSLSAITLCVVVLFGLRGPAPGSAQVEGGS